MTVGEFLDILENNQLVEPRLVEDFRRQVAKINRVVDPKEIARLLVAHGDLTAKQAFRVLSNRPRPSPRGAEPGSSSVPLVVARPPAAQTPAAKAPAAEAKRTAARPPNAASIESIGAHGPPMPPAAKQPPAPQPAAQPGQDDELRLAPIDSEVSRYAPADASRSRPAPSSPPRLQPPDLPRRSRPTAIEIELSTFDELLEEAGLGAFDPQSVAASGAAMVHHGARVRARRLAKPALAVVAVLMAGGGGFAYLLHFREADSAARFADAERAFSAEQLAQCIGKYDEFLRNYPNHDQAPAARVHRAIAQVLTAVEGQPEWPAVLPIVRDVLESVAGEPLYLESRAPIGPALARLANELVKSAVAARGPEQAARLTVAREALALAGDPRHIALADRPWQLLEQWAEALMSAERDAQRNAALLSAVDVAERHAAAGKVGEFDAVLDQLHATFPDLATNERLVAAARSLSQRESSQAIAADVKFVHQLPSDSPIVAEAILRTDVAVEIGDGPLLAANLAGVATAIDERGSMRWRRYVGGQQSPVATPAGEFAAMIAADESRLDCVDYRTGERRWSLLSPEPILSVAACGDQFVMTTRGGIVAAIDAKSGDRRRQIRLPRGLSAPPLLDDGRLYAVATREALYVIRCDTLECERTAFLGHADDSILISPVVAGRVLVVAENRGLTSAIVRQFALESGAPVRESSPVSVVGQVVALAGHATGASAIVLSDGRVLARFSSDEGRVGKFIEWPAAASSEQQLWPASAPWFADGTWWLGGVGLRQGKPGAAELVTALDERIVNIVGQVGDQLICLARDPQSATSMIASVSLKDQAVLWQRPWADGGRPAISLEDNQTAVAVTVSGRRYRWATADARGLQSLVPTNAAPTKALATAREAPLAVYWLPVPQAAIRCSAFGQMDWLDESSGRPLASIVPYAALSTWNFPLPSVAAGGESLFVTDGRQRLGRVEARRAGQVVDFSVAAESKLAAVVTALATAGDKVYAAGADGSVQILDSTALRSLGAFKSPRDQSVIQLVPLANISAPGPALLALTDRLDVVAYDPAGNSLWRSTSAAGKLVGGVALDEERLAVVFARGVIDVLRIASGERVATVDLLEPVAALGGVASGALILATPDGRLLKVAP